MLLQEAIRAGKLQCHMACMFTPRCLCMQSQTQDLYNYAMASHYVLDFNAVQDSYSDSSSSYGDYGSSYGDYGNSYTYDSGSQQDDSWSWWDSQSDPQQDDSWIFWDTDTSFNIWEFFVRFDNVSWDVLADWLLSVRGPGMQH